jgi:hypothetical protein
MTHTHTVTPFFTPLHDTRYHILKPLHDNAIIYNIFGHCTAHVIILYFTPLHGPRHTSSYSIFRYCNHNSTPLHDACLGLARTIYIRCIYGIFGIEITTYTVIYGAYIRFWPTLRMFEPPLLRCLLLFFRCCMTPVRYYYFDLVLFRYMYLKFLSRPEQSTEQAAQGMFCAS